MTLENGKQVPQSETLSKSEKKLEKLNSKIWEANRYLMRTFFQDETWSVRQGGTYRFAFLDGEGDGENHDWDKEERIVDNIVAELGDRISYFEAAYHFPDNLSALGQMTQPFWVELMLRKKPKERKSKVAEDIHKDILQRLAKLTGEFETFLESSDFMNAFTIKVDRKTGEYQIVNLPLDIVELRKKWEEWFGTNQAKKTRKKQ
jgi:hypothetical protein